MYKSSLINPRRNYYEIFQDQNVMITHLSPQKQQSNFDQQIWKSICTARQQNPQQSMNLGNKSNSVAKGSGGIQSSRCKKFDLQPSRSISNGRQGRVEQESKSPNLKTLVAVQRQSNQIATEIDQKKHLLNSSVVISKNKNKNNQLEQLNMSQNKLYCERVINFYNQIEQKQKNQRFKVVQSMYDESNMKRYQVGLTRIQQFCNQDIPDLIKEQSERQQINKVSVGQFLQDDYKYCNMSEKPRHKSIMRLSSIYQIERRLNQNYLKMSDKIIEEEYKNSKLTPTTYCLFQDKEREEVLDTVVAGFKQQRSLNVIHNVKKVSANTAIDSTFLNNTLTKYQRKRYSALLHSVQKKIKWMKIENISFDQVVHYKIFINLPYKFKESRIFYECVIDGDCNDIIEMLQYNKFLVYDQNERRETPLHVAVRKNNIKMVEILLNYKPIIDFKNISGFTPLYVAVQQLHQGIVRILLYNQANPYSDNLNNYLKFFRYLDLVTADYFKVAKKLHLVHILFPKSNFKRYWVNNQYLFQ